MAKVLVNYIHDVESDTYELLRGAKYVFADMPTAVLETEHKINIPLVVPINGLPTVVDKLIYEAKNKKFKLVADEKGIVTENPNGAEVWLPRDTDINKLRFLNGQLVMIDEEEPQPQPVKRKAKKKEA